MSDPAQRRWEWWGKENIPTTFPTTLLLLKIERKFQLLELLSIYAEQLFYLKFFDSYNYLEVIG